VSMMSTSRCLRRDLACRIRIPKLNIALAVAIASMLVAVGTGDAIASEPYGEVTRFGGAVDEFASGAIPGQDAGKFVLPVGFAVEAQSPTGEKNAVYVLDRTLSDTATGELDYRLQKVASNEENGHKVGEVLGSTTIDEKYTDSSSFSDVHPLIGLAVDPTRKRVYAIECAMVNQSGSTYVPVVGKLVAWSTEPTAGKELERAEPTVFKADSFTGASEVAGESTFKVSGGLSEVLYAPAGLAVESSANGKVAIEAQEGVSGSGEGKTTIQLVDPSGALGTRWTDKNEVEGGDLWTGNGVFAGPASEEFGVDLFAGEKESPNLAISTGSTTAEEITSTPIKDADQALGASLAFPLSREEPNGERSFAEIFAAGTPIVHLAGGKVYASVFANPETEGPSRDVEISGVPWEVSEGGKLKKPYVPWDFGEAFGAGNVGNIGIRLFELNGAGKAPTIVDTVGGGAPNPASPGTPVPDSVLGSCDIDSRSASLAAGAEGAVFVLTQPRGNIGEAGETAYEYDDEVIEFAPGGKQACPGIREGSVEVEEDKAWKELQKGSEPEPSLTTEEGVPVTLSAKSLDQLEANRIWQYTAFDLTWPSVYEWTPFAFEWNMEGESTGGPANDGYTIVNKMEAGSGYKWPSPEVKEYVYKKIGVYHASLRVDGDYGMKEFPFLVHVLGSSPPEAKFTCKETGAGTSFTVKAGKGLACDASESTPTPGTEVEYYKWEFGDGTKATETGPKAKPHIFTKAGRYTIKLTIYDKAGTTRESAPVSHEVTVEPEEKTTTITSSSTSQTSTSTSKTTVVTTTKTSTSKSGGAPKKLTRHEELERALKACKKDKSKQKRLGCEKAARKRYAPPKKKASSKKGKKGSKRK
jgi:PKD repeat protein